MYWTGHGLVSSLISLMIGLLILAIVIAITVRVFDLAGRRHDEDRPTPYEILAGRYARGEISEEEYRHRLNVLGGDDHVVH
jgi:putative membrane protein